MKGIAVYLLIAGFSHWSMSNILGIQQIKMHVTGLFLNASTKLDDSGILGKIRHPVYAGTILLIWANDMDIIRIIITSLMTLYFILGALIEERKRLIEFGLEYSLYREKVSMFFPAKYIINQLFSLRDRVSLKM
jgi:protein-S-isoprenylcysteine O-methyltransferase Ste14